MYLVSLELQLDNLFVLTFLVGKLAEQRIEPTLALQFPLNLPWRSNSRAVAKSSRRLLASVNRRVKSPVAEA